MKLSKPDDGEEFHDEALLDESNFSVVFGLKSSSRVI